MNNTFKFDVVYLCKTTKLTFSQKDAIFNPSTSTGWLITMMKTRRTQNKQTKPKKKTDENSSNAVPDSEYTQSDADSDILYLKQTPYNEDTELDIKLKLERTVKYRQQLLTDANLNMLANFPYLFTHDELVISLE